MGKSLLVWSRALGVAVTSGNWTAIGGAGGAGVGTEANQQMVVHAPGTFSLLATKVDNVGTGRSCRFRDTGANGNQIVSPTDITAGVFRDSVNTDVLQDGDKVDLAFAEVGATVWYWAACAFAATTGHACYYFTTGSVTSTGANENFSHPLSGELAASVAEASAGCPINVAGKGWYFQAYVTANTRSTTTIIKARLNAANANITVGVTAGTTGLIEETVTVNDDYVDGDLVNFWSRTSTGSGNFTVSMYGLVIIPTSGIKNDLFASCAGGAGIARTASATTHYVKISGDISSLTNTTESSVAIRHGFKVTITNLRLSIITNTYTGALAVKLRVANADGTNVLSVAAGTTGVIEDTIHSDAALEDDDVDIALSGGTSGSCTITNFAVTEEEVVASSLAARSLVLSQAVKRASYF